MVKILGVFVGSGNVEEASWRPSITAVENALNSWRQRSLSYGGRALVINALVLSRRSVTPRDLTNTGSPAGFPKTRAKKERGMLRIKSAMLSLCLCECGPYSPIATGFVLCVVHGLPYSCPSVGRCRA